MKGMDKISRGTGFLGTVLYTFERDPKDRAAGKPAGILIGGNMAGHDPHSLAKEFDVSRRLRRDIKKPVWHSTLRLPKGERQTNEQWAKMCDDYMIRMGFHSTHQRCYVLHDDEDGQHVHIVASRIDLNGEIYYGRNENLISTRVIQQLEQDYGLKITKGPGSEPSSRRKPSKNQIEKALRTGQRPAMQIIQDVIDQVLSPGPILAPDLVTLLQEHGIVARPNIAATGKFSGFSFGLNGDVNKSDQPIFYKGSSLGKAYTAGGLLNRGLQYDPHRDMPLLTGRHPEPPPDYSGEPTIRRRNGSREFSLIVFMRFEPAPGGGQLYRWQSGAPAFYDRGDEIVCSGRMTDAKIRAMLDLAAQKGWSRIELSGPKEFQEAAAQEAARRGISVFGTNKEIQELWRKEYDRTAAERNRKPEPRSDRLNAHESAPASGCGMRGLHECTLVSIGAGSELLLQADARDRVGNDEQNIGDPGLRREDVIDGIKTRTGSATATTAETTDTAGNRAGTTGDPETPARNDGNQKGDRESGNFDQDVCSSAAGGNHPGITAEPRGHQEGSTGRDPEDCPHRAGGGLAALKKADRRFAEENHRSYPAEKRPVRVDQEAESPLPLCSPSPGG